MYTISEDAIFIAEDVTAARSDLRMAAGGSRVGHTYSRHDCYLTLPTSWDVHEWSIMHQFCDSLPDARMRSDFFVALRGRGAFRRFKDQLMHHGLWENWNKHRRSALRELVIEWCRAHDVPFQEERDLC